MASRIATGDVDPVRRSDRRDKERRAAIDGKTRGPFRVKTCTP